MCQYAIIIHLHERACYFGAAFFFSNIFFLFVHCHRGVVAAVWGLISCCGIKKILLHGMNIHDGVLLSAVEFYLL